MLGIKLKFLGPNMSTVKLERKIAIDLLETKIQVIKNEIQIILKNWNQESAIEMIEKTRKGEISEAEGDAISLTNLLEKQKYLEDILNSIKE